MKNLLYKSLACLRGPVLVTFALLAVAAPIPAVSQSCALCYTQAAASGSKMIQALKSGILILIIPPTIGSVGLVFLVHRRTNQVRRDPNSDEPGQDW